MCLRCVRARLREDESVGVFEHKVHLFSNTETPAYVHYGCRPAGIMGLPPPEHSQRYAARARARVGTRAPQSATAVKVAENRVRSHPLGLKGFLISCG